MRTVGVRSLKNKLSEYLRLVEAGETVLVTDRDRVVAQLGPPAGGVSPLGSDARLAEAVRKGWITPAVRRGGWVPSLPVDQLERIQADLDRAREDR